MTSISARRFMSSGDKSGHSESELFRKHPSYIRSVNKALKYIDAHLATSLSLKEVAQAAHYSPYHFHRIFKALVNESLHAYVNRRRMEKAASVLFRQREVSVAELLRYGFNSSSAFTKNFRKFYGVSPTHFRKLSPGRFSRLIRKNSKNGQAVVTFEDHICHINECVTWINMNSKVEIKNIPEMPVAYITHIGHPDLIGGAYEKLMKWAAPKQLLETPNLRMITIYHDSLKVVDWEQARLSACLLLNETIAIDDGEVGLQTIAGGRHAVAHLEITLPEFDQVWSSLFVWLNENGYKVREDSNSFEIYYNNFNEHPEKKCIVDLCIPVE